MFLFYFDEVKLNPPVQTSFWLGGIGAHEDHIANIEECTNRLAERVFGRRAHEKGTEFHGYAIFQGKGAFKGVDPNARLSILKELLEICAGGDVIRYFVEICPENLVTRQAFEDIAFMYLCEGVDGFLEQYKANGMMIGDFDDKSVGTTVASLSRYREGGTRWSKGKRITRILDTAHFTRSHHSRLIQLADVFLYAR